MTGLMNRRCLLGGGTGLALGMLGGAPGATAQAKDDADTGFIGPKEGYSPQIGTLVSMMTTMREYVVDTVSKLKQPDLDFLLDARANTIGALLMHLAATDTYYRLHTFGEQAWGSWEQSIKKQWDVPMELGEPARQSIKGRDIGYYLSILEETRAQTFAEFHKRDDKWLLSRDKVTPGWGNYYAEWFHVCEHESNHNGQIKMIKIRLPGAKAAG